ncbi:type I glyceraldehyde-3-phosphate dehydrogenase [Leucobacter chromiireducens]|uniref:Glyceraldehyde-3-phosphate dehydrogenase n=1 Tax=Leucobacter chromiireducens subsp. chromiireducens TaxID=660067 RepID=A0ABS1SP25_9MICO|nr:type I glyceraldehyde-3-phosphate dehydrogenase [Leucobacter chromiireducens]MBL3689224.1 type I glyceraldehyde-3-phosphate dehydrogenase [Leucobacter chromiireducens subsp. chromiireducens]
MTGRVAINGFGRIGRGVLRATLEQGSELEVVAINDLGDITTLAHLLARDSVYGALPWPVTVEGNELVIGERRIRILAERSPADLPWGELGIDVVLESTGIFTDADAARQHLDAGARRVLVSAPSNGADLTIVVGVNDEQYDPTQHVIVSNASCTTNALAPLAQVLDALAPIEYGAMTTVHAYTQDQRLADAPHSDLRRARAAALNIIPTSTGAAKAIGLVLPQLDGKLTGSAIRVPVPVGSIVELHATLAREVTEEEVLQAYRDAAAAGPLHGVLEYSEEPLVSTDIVGNPHPSIFDSALTRVHGRHVSVVAWYDNEMGFSNRAVAALEMLAAS